MSQSNAHTTFAATFPHRSNEKIIGGTNQCTLGLKTADFACTCGSRPGRMFITNEAICFIAGLIGDFKLEIPMEDVQFVEKSTMGFGLVSNSMEVILTNEKSVYFSAMFYRDGAYDLIQNVLFPEQKTGLGSMSTATVSQEHGPHITPSTTSTSSGELSHGNSFKTTSMRQRDKSSIMGESVSGALSSASSLLGGAWSRARQAVAHVGSTGTSTGANAVHVRKRDVLPEWDEDYNAKTVMILAGELTSRNHSSYLCEIRTRHLDYLEISRDRAINTLKRIDESSDDNVNRAGSVSFQPLSMVRECPSCGQSFGVFSSRKHCILCGKIYCGDCIKRRLTMPSGRKVKGVCDMCADLVESVEKRREWAQKHARNKIQAYLPVLDEQARFENGPDEKLQASVHEMFTELENLTRAVNQLIIAGNEPDSPMKSADLRVLKGLRMVMLKLLEENVPVFRRVIRSDHGSEWVKI